MAELDTGNDRVLKICEALKNETLLPARQQASEIVENANLQREEILQKARAEADKIIEQARTLMEQKRKTLESSLQLAARQSVEALRQQVEKHFFAETLKELSTQTLNKADIIARLINSIVLAIEKEGVDANLSAFIAKSVKPEEVGKLLLQEVVARLRDKGVLVGDFAGGAKIKLQNGMMTLDISEGALQELLLNFIRADFRKMLFQ